MKRFLIFTGFLLSGIFIKAQTQENPSFGSENTFEIMTWNIETFPKNGQISIDYATQIIEALNVDFIAIQEVSEIAAFDQLVSNLTNYKGKIESTYYDGLAFLYKPDVITINKVYRIYSTSAYWNTFPRAPMVIDITYQNQKIFIINNHLKCCGDGLLNLSDPSDEEYRRYEAMYLLKSFMDLDLPNENIILVGDLNDELTDPSINNVFEDVLNDPTNYLFTDFDIATGNSSHWSYPSWPSHLDHILISNELFDEFGLSDSSIQTLKIEDYLTGGWDEYNQNVTDHRPVALKLLMDSGLGIKEVPEKDTTQFINYPNPFKSETTFSFHNTYGNAEIQIYNVLGQLILSEKIPNGQTVYQWTPKGLTIGIYYVKLILDKKEVGNRKVILSK
ncbi:endonuclease/exonuclease/phosphatase family protein [Gaetbulibacter aquiaggeris]|uniref:Endonuclease/exonuclease/phosphatase family protein n=1 Tax=Gaetbulibacter aquiaggeris TaxID=1735373 RepID=A0ABW7MQS5_9FLAO